jgi:alcohol dehydrogenase
MRGWTIFGSARSPNSLLSRTASLALKPKGLTMEEAASIPLVALTAWQALVEQAKLQKGQKVFIQAGSGGVGTFAIQLARHLGATVATTTSTANVALVKGLGADVVVDYKTQDFEDALRDYDIVLNSQDGKTLDKFLRVLKAGGKLISISGPPDPAFGKDIGAPGFVQLVMRLLSMGTRRKARHRGISYDFLFMKANGSQLREITRLFDAGVIRPVVDFIKAMGFRQVDLFGFSMGGMIAQAGCRGSGCCRGSRGAFSWRWSPGTLNVPRTRPL